MFPTQFIEPAAAGGKLREHLGIIPSVKSLQQSRIDGALAVAIVLALRFTEDAEHIVCGAAAVIAHAAVANHASVHIIGKFLHALAGAGGQANGVGGHFGGQALDNVTAKVLVIMLVGGVHAPRTLVSVGV